MSAQQTTDDGAVADDDGSSDDVASPTVLAPTDGVDALTVGDRYLAVVNGVEKYGAFVSLTPATTTDVTGLVHQSDLPALTKPRDYREGEKFVVEYLGDQSDDDKPKLAFRGCYSEHNGAGNGPIPDTNPASPVRDGEGAVGGDAPAADGGGTDDPGAGRSGSGSPPARRFTALSSGPDGEGPTPPGELPGESVGEVGDVLARLDALEAQVVRRLDAGFGGVDDVLAGTAPDATDMAAVAQDRIATFTADGYRAVTISQDEHENGDVTLSVTLRPDEEPSDN